MISVDTSDVTVTGTLTATGTLSKGSGTFDIQHPLSSNVEDRLVHSFVEGPRCDNIYRGSVTMSSGTATVNLDSDCVESTDQGTFIALNKNLSKYLYNNSSVDRVRGTISGNILTITCENVSSNDTIDWMVVGERSDTFVSAWERTNVGGSFVTQYTRPA